MYRSLARQYLTLYTRRQSIVDQVHLLSDLLGKADGVLAFREVLDASPALRALMLTTDSSSSSTAAGGATGGAGGDHTTVAEEAKYHLVQEKLSEWLKTSIPHGRMRVKGSPRADASMYEGVEARLIVLGSTKSITAERAWYEAGLRCLSNGVFVPITNNSRQSIVSMHGLKL